MSQHEPGSMNRTRIVKFSVGLTVTQWAGLLMRFTATLVAARIVTPAQIGYVAWIGIWPVYVSWFTFGVINGVERLVPIRRGEGRAHDVEAMKQASFSVTMTLMAACVLAGILARLAAAPWQDSYDRWKYVASGLLCAATLLHRHVSMLLVVEKRFRLLALKWVVDGVLWWFMLPLACAGTAGLTFRLLLVSFITPIVLLVKVRGWERYRFDPALLAMLSSSGWKIMIAGFFVSLAFAFDRTLVALNMDDTALGHYMIAYLVISLIQPLTVGVGRVLYPNLGETFGQSRDVSAVARHALGPACAMAALMVPCVLIGRFLAEPMTAFLLPQYLPGVAAARIVLLAAVVAPFVATHVFYNVIKRQGILIAVMFSGLLVQTAVSMHLYSRDPNLECFAWGFVAGVSTTAVLLVTGLLWSIYGSGQRADAC